MEVPITADAMFARDSRLFAISIRFGSQGMLHFGLLLGELGRIHKLRLTVDSAYSS